MDPLHWPRPVGDRAEPLVGWRQGFSGILQMVNIGVLIALMSGAPIINLVPDAQAEITRIVGVNGLCAGQSLD